MKKIYFIILFIIIGLQGYSQWTNLYIAYQGSQNLYTLRQYDHNFLYGGGVSGFVTSTDAGKTFTSGEIVDSTNHGILGTTLYSIKFITPKIGIAACLTLSEPYYTILRTVNGGKNWKVVAEAGTPDLFNSTNKVFFVDTLTGFVGGNQGYFFKTTDAGATWSLSNFYFNNENISDIYFKNLAVGFVATGYHLYKTTDGGYSWDTIPSAYPNSICFPTSNVGYALGGGVLKTTDGGNTWQNVGGALPDNVFAAQFISVDTGFFASNNAVYRTTDGGQTWEKDIVSQTLNDIAFYGSDTGYIAGQAGLAMITTNGGKPWRPIVNFSINGYDVCPGTPVQMNNLSNNHNLSYTWRANGVIFSTDYAPVYTPTAGNQGTIVTISLTGYNGVANDSVSQQIEIGYLPSIQPTTLASDSSAACFGSAAGFSIENSREDYVYYIRNDTTSLSHFRGWGGGSSYNFQIPVDGDTLYNLYITNNNACGTASQTIKLKTISITPTDVDVKVSREFICYGDTATIYIPHPQKGITYMLQINGNPTFVNPKTLSSGALAFIVSVDTSTTFNIEAFYSNCSLNLSKKIHIGVNNPHAYFAFSNFNPEFGEPVRLVNNSISSGGSYTWRFGANATPSVSTDSLPASLTFNKLGLYRVTLKTTSKFGCSDSLTRFVHVIQPYAKADSCGYSCIIGNGYEKNIFCLKYDSKGEYGLLINDECPGQYCNYPIQSVSSNNSNVYVDGFDYIPGYSSQYNYSLTKYSKYGVPKWNIDLVSGFRSFCFDSSDNLYTIAGSGATMISSDYKAFNFMNSGNGTLCKYDTMGVLLWYVNLPYSSNNVKVDKDANVYVYGTSWVVKVSPSGQILWSMPKNIIDIAFDTNNDLWVLSAKNFGISHYSAAGQLIDSIQSLKPVSGQVQMDRLLIDGNNNMYVAGNYTGTFVWNNDTLPTITPSYYNPDQNEIVAKMNKSGKQSWIRQFKSNHAESLGGFTLEDNILALSLDVNLPTTGLDTISVNGLPNLVLSNYSSVFFKCDTSNKNAELIKLYSPTQPPSGDYTVFSQSSHLDVLHNNVLISFSYLDYFYLMGDSINLKSEQNGYFVEGDDVVFNGNFSCVDPNGPPLSKFNYTKGCEGINEFSDASNNYSVLWNWSFPGGTPVSSTLQNPTVTYSDTGQFEVTFVAGNSYGYGDTLKRTISISPLPDVTLSASVDTVCNSAPKVLLIGLPAGGIYSGTGLQGNMFDPSIYKPGAVNLPQTYYQTYTVINQYGCEKAATLGITVTVCSGIDNLEKGTLRLNIFPNPATESLYINPAMSGVSLRVYDSRGDLCIYKSSFSGNGLDISSLNDGLYHLSFINSNGTENTASFIKIDE